MNLAAAPATAQHHDSHDERYGLWQALERQGRTAEAEAMELRFRTAWVDADVDLTSSRF